MDTSSALCSGDHTLLSSRVIKCSDGIVVHKYYDAVNLSSVHHTLSSKIALTSILEQPSLRELAT